jgi:hypothetical protein
MSIAGNQRGTKAFKERWNGLISFWREKKRGLYDLDITDWRMSEGLTPRTARENYWDAGEQLGIIRVVYEKKQKFWEYTGFFEKDDVKTSQQFNPEPRDNTEETDSLDPDSSTPFMDLVKRKKLEELKQKLRR